MRSIITTLLLLPLTACLISIASCKKTSSSVNGSIVGTWTFKSEENHVITNNVTQSDNSAPVPSGTTVTFTASGEIIAPIGINILPTLGSYQVTGNMLTFFDSLAFTTGSMTITNLSGNSLSLRYNDTSSLSPTVSYDQVTDSYTR